MPIAERASYLLGLDVLLRRTWPANSAVTLVFHGHSVPAGYFRTPRVDTFGAYPHQLHRVLAEKYPFAVINVLVTAVGGEHSESGAARFAVW
jgi:acyl-CoA thioesterase-1